MAGLSLETLFAVSQPLKAQVQQPQKLQLHSSQSARFEIRGARYATRLVIGVYAFSMAASLPHLFPGLIGCTRRCDLRRNRCPG